MRSHCVNAAIEHKQRIQYNTEYGSAFDLAGCTMRYVITESFDKSELNRCFEADIVPKIGKAIKTRSGKWYRINDVGWTMDPFDHHANVRVLISRME